MKLKCEMSYAEILAALGAGLAISNLILQREANVEVAFDMLAATGTYLISKTAMQLSTDAREWMLGSPSTPGTSTPINDKKSNKYK